MPVNPLPPDDLEMIFEQTAELWQDLRDQAIFITGGTGFFGMWLLESLLCSNRKLHLNVRATVLTRDVRSFREKAPHIAADSAIDFLEGDVRSFGFPNREYTHVIHAATETVVSSAADSQLRLLDTIIDGTRHVLDFARQCGARKLLVTSSGAVYGKQPAGLTHVPETYQGAPDSLQLSSAYGQGKRISEQLCALYASASDMQCMIARCWAFVGPHLPLSQHFAIGNFIRDCLLQQPISVRGDGTPMRSYLYAADLAVWLWTILFRGRSLRAYNVGSDAALSIAALAQETAAVLQPNLAIALANRAPEGQSASYYVPSTERARADLGLHQTVSLRDAITRTADWYRRDTYYK